MAKNLKVLLQNRDIESLTQVAMQEFGIGASEDRLLAICEASGGVGGTAADPWSTSTWSMWFRSRLTASDSENDPAARLRELKRALRRDAGSLFNSGETEFFEVGISDELLEEYGHEMWTQLFPQSEDFGAELTLRLRSSGVAEQLGKVPSASWLFARLTALGVSGAEKESDLGGIIFDLLACQARRLAAMIRIEANAGEIRSVIEARNRKLLSTVTQQFLDTLMEEPHVVAPCRIKVRAVELGGVNEFGWDGSAYLGLRRSL
jgi:hypothetical protein